MLDFDPDTSVAPAALVEAHHSLCSEFSTFAALPLLVPVELIWARRDARFRHGSSQTALMAGLHRIYLGAAYFHYYRNQLLGNNTVRPATKPTEGTPLVVVQAFHQGIKYRAGRWVNVPNEFLQPNLPHQKQAAIGALVISAQAVLERIFDLASRMAETASSENLDSCRRVRTRSESQSAISTVLKYSNYSLNQAERAAATHMAQEDWELFSQVGSQAEIEGLRHQWAHGKDFEFDFLDWKVWSVYLQAMHRSYLCLLHFIFRSMPWDTLADWYAKWRSNDATQLHVVATETDPFIQLQTQIHVRR